MNVANDGAGKTSGPYTFTLFASTDSTLDSGDSRFTWPSVASPCYRKKNKTFVFHVPTLPVNLNGSYHILAQVAAPGIGNGAVNRRNRHHAGACRFEHDAAGDSLHRQALGKKMNVVVTIANGGNVAAKGVLDIAFAASISPTGSAPLRWAPSPRM